MEAKSLGDITRRSFITGSAATGILAGMGINPFSAHAAGLSDSDIKKLMARGSVEDILGNDVKYITPATWNSEVLSGAKDGALVLVYSNSRTHSKRSGIIISELKKKYNDQIDFYGMDDEPLIKEYGMDRMGGLMMRFGIRSTPSIAMYSRFDLVKGETPDNNDGKLKRVDTLKGGPNARKWVNVWLDFISNSWIPTNITNLNNKYAWRFNNSSNEVKAYYGK